MKLLKICRLSLIMAVGLLSFTLPQAVSAQVPLVSEVHQEPQIRVGLWSNQASVLIAGDNGIEVINRDTRGVIGRYQPREKIAVSSRDGEIAINGAVIPASAIRITVAQEDADGTIEVNRHHYRGEVEIHRTAGKSGITAVNILPLEQYVSGIIAREISPDWPAAALRAQAVAARTYALYNLGKHADDGFDVCATTDCQVYGGRDLEDPRSNSAVKDTAGVVIAYQGKIIPAYFFSDGGGYTENVENVWGTYQPFLRGVPDFDQASPHYKWEKQITPRELDETLERAGLKIGQLEAVELSPLTKQPVAASDRGVSGRVKTLRLIGSSGTAELSGSRLRTLLGLNSTLFDIRTEVPVPKEIKVDITDSYGDHESKVIPVSIPPQPEKNFLGKGDSIRQISRRPGEVIVFNGLGWGHGIGMSQWGAKAMAEKESAGAVTYYQSILKHYYQGVDILKAY